MQADPYATGILFPDHHDRLVADLDRYARDAGIQPRCIWTPLPKNGEDEAEYVRRFHFHKVEGVKQGICYVRATPTGDPEERMSLLAGALVRNFIRARVMTLHSVLEIVNDGGDPQATALLIPNFFLARSESGGGASLNMEDPPASKNPDKAPPKPSGKGVATGGASISNWKIQALYDLIVKRGSTGRQTIIYATSLAELGLEYGAAFRRIVEKRFIQVEI